MTETAERVVIFLGSCVVVMGTVLVFLTLANWLFVLP